MLKLKSNYSFDHILQLLRLTWLIQTPHPVNTMAKLCASRKSGMANSSAFVLGFEVLLNDHLDCLTSTLIEETFELYTRK